MAKGKKKVRDARFRDRDGSPGSSPPPSSPSTPAPRVTPSPASTPPPRTTTGARPGGAAPPPRRPAAPVSEPAPALEGAKTPRWLSANVLVPAVLVIAVGAAFYEMVRKPSEEATEDAGAATADAGATPTATPEAGTPAPAPAPTPAPTPTPAADGGGRAAADGDGSPVEARHPEPTTPDPRNGRFTLAQATAGLAGSGPLVAEIETSMGNFTCNLLQGEAPNAVANFVGLARGLRDFWDPVEGRWTRRPFFDGSIFHRVIPGFMIQGGDVLRSGFGGTGYEFGDENVQGHDAAGLLCMANHGPNTNGGQFFITEAPKAHLDGSYSIFGRCTPTDLVQRIANVPRGENDRPVSPVFIRHVRVRRGS